MSVKLIIVALLAATVTGRGKVATEELCEENDKCSCATPKVTKYAVGQCRKYNEQKYYKIDDCTVGEGFSMNFFSNSVCKPQEFVFKANTACSVLSFDGIKCEGDTISFLNGCSTATCDSDSCASTITIPSSDTTTCFSLGPSYFKLPAAVDCASTEEAISIKTYNNADCSGDGSLTPINKECAAKAHGKGTCTAGGTKATINLNCNDNCNDCGDDLDFEIEVGKKKEHANAVYYLESCKDGQEFTVQRYESRELSKDCKDNGDGTSEKGTCTYVTSTATIPTTTTTSTTGSSTTSNTDTTSSNTDTTSSIETTDNNTTSDGMNYAPVRSFGVLALLVCLLVGVY